MTLGPRQVFPDPVVIGGKPAPQDGKLRLAYFFMLNYDAMKHLKLKPYAALLALVALFTACSGSVENSGAPNTSDQQQANSNAAPQPQVAQGNPTPSPAPLAVQPIPPPPAPAEKPAANSKADVATPSAAGNARAPKLVAPGKKIDYGKQPQEKTLVRAIVIKNGGLANLNIESVVPS